MEVIMNGKRIYDLFINLYKRVLILLTSLMFVVVGINVFCRYALNHSLGWADELARFMFIWISFLGAVLAYQENEHVGLDFVVEKLPAGRGKDTVKLVSELLVFVVVFFLLKYGLIVADSATNVSPALYIPMKTVYMIVPVSAFFMLIISIGKIIKYLKILFVTPISKIERDLN